MKKTATETFSLQYRVWQSYFKHTYEITFRRCVETWQDLVKRYAASDNYFDNT